MNKVLFFIVIIIIIIIITLSDENLFQWKSAEFLLMNVCKSFTLHVIASATN